MGDSLAFSANKRGKFLALASEMHFDFIITSVGIREALFLLMAAKQGKKCALFCSDDFNCKINKIVAEKNSRKKSVLAFREQFPHLILPDEYLHIQEATTLKKLKPNAIKRKDVAKYESQINVSDNEMVCLEKEFKLSPHRLLMSLLKNAVQAGAIVLNHIDIDSETENELLIKDSLSSSEQNHTLTFNQKITFRIEEQTPEREIHFLLSKKNLFLKRSLKFPADGKLVRLTRYQDYFLLTAQETSDKDSLIHTILQKLNLILSCEEIYSDTDLLSTEELQYGLQDDLYSILQNTEKLCAEKLNLTSSDFLKQIENLNNSDAQFEGRIEIHELIEFADFKFDEAKQTGINPISFKNLFYRFGSDIDILIEKAYELRPKSGPGDELWAFVQLWYTYQNEMICNESDFLNRLRKNNTITAMDLAKDSPFRTNNLTKLSVNML